MPLTPSVAAGDAPLNSPSDANSSGSSPSTLAGDTPGFDQGTSKGGSNDGLKAAGQQLKQMQAMALQLANQFPSAAPSFRAVLSALKSAERQIIANPGRPEPDAPNVGG